MTIDDIMKNSEKWWKTPQKQWKTIKKPLKNTFFRKFMSSIHFSHRWQIDDIDDIDVISQSYTSPSLLPLNHQSTERPHLIIRFTYSFITSQLDPHLTKSWTKFVKHEIYEFGANITPSLLSLNHRSPERLHLIIHLTPLLSHHNLFHLFQKAEHIFFDIPFNHAF